MENQYQNDKLWIEITRESDNYENGYPVIFLEKLKKILEKYQVLGNEK